MKFLQSKSMKNILTLLSGASLAQLIPLLASPLLTRLYSPAEFGLFGLFSSLTIVLAGMLGGKYERAVVLPKEDAAGLALLNLSFAVAVLAALFFTGLTFAFSSPVLAALGIDELNQWIWLVPIAGFASFAQQAGVCFSNRHYLYGRIACGQITQTGTGTLLQLLAGVLQFGAIGLITGLVVGKAASAVYLLKSRGSAVLDLRYLTSKRKRLFAVARRHRNFPLHNASTVFLDNITLQAVVLIASGAYALEHVGQLVLTQRVIALPLAMIGYAVGEVFFRKVADAMTSRARILPILLNFAKGLALIALPALLVLIIVGPYLFEFVFGAEWQAAGELSRVLVVVFAARLIASPLAMIFAATSRMVPMAAWRIIYFTVSFGVLIPAASSLTFAQFIYVFVALDVSMYLLYFLFAVYVARKVDKEHLTPVSGRRSS